MKNKNGIISLILLLIAGVLIFFFKHFFSIVLVIIAFVLSISSLKEKSFVSWLSFILSLILLIYIVSAFALSLITVNSTLSNTNIKTYQNYEKMMERYANDYVFDNSITENKKISIEELENYGMPERKNGCTGYVIYNYEENDVNAYINCKDYKTKITEIKSLENLKLSSGTSSVGFTYEYDGDKNIHYNEWDGNDRDSKDVKVSKTFENNIIKILEKYNYVQEDEYYDEQFAIEGADSKRISIKKNNNEEAYFIIKEDVEEAFQELNNYIESVY